MQRSNSKSGQKSVRMEKLEERQFLTAVTIDNKTQVAQLTDNSGNALNSSRVTVKFSENVTLADATKFRMFGYSINPTSGSGTAQQKTTINITSVTAGADGNKLVFLTDRRVRKGTRLNITDGAITNTVDSTTTGDLSSLVPKGLNKERFTLACRAFAPTNLAFFNQGLYSGAPAVTSTNTAPSSATVLASLTTFLDAKVAAGNITAEQKVTALAQYNDATNASLVPSANLRAGIVSLVGTVGEPAIASLLTTSNVTGKKYTIIDFSTEVSGGAVVAETKGTPATGRLRTLLKPSFAGEPFQALGAILAHEALHQNIVGAGQDLPDGQNEEIFANTVETIVYAQHLLIDKTIAAKGTLLTTTQNGQLLALLNSGLALYPRVGTLDAPLIGGQNVFVNGNSVAGGDYSSFEDYIRRIYAARNFGNSVTDAPPVALEMKNLIRVASETGAQTFSTTQISQFDNSQQIVSDKAAVRLAAILKLQITR